MTELTRVVKLQLKKGKFEEFKMIFDFGKNVVIASEGCRQVQLQQDGNNPDLVFTISHWKDESCLDKYRSSEKFRNYWPKIKSLLAEKAEVWSLFLVDQKVK